MTLSTAPWPAERIMLTSGAARPGVPPACISNLASDRPGAVGGRPMAAPFEERPLQKPSLLQRLFSRQPVENLGLRIGNLLARAKRIVDLTPDEVEGAVAGLRADEKARRALPALYEGYARQDLRSPNPLAGRPRVPPGGQCLERVPSDDNGSDDPPVHQDQPNEPQHDQQSHAAEGIGRATACHDHLPLLDRQARLVA